MDHSKRKPSIIAHPSSPLLTTMLKDVSRSFYLTIRVLPRAIRSQIGLAYLLARATDTIADTEIVPVQERLSALNHLRERILGGDCDALDFRSFASHQKSSCEQVLLERIEEVLAMLQLFTYSDRERIREVLQTITSGQELDIQRFSGAGKGNVISLKVDHELDDYTYRVAGCVGEFWTKMCRGHLFPYAPVDQDFLLANGVRFGKGLQLVNILRDLPRDLQQGRCYLPANRLQALGLQGVDLLKAENEGKVRPLYDEYLSVAEDHLNAGWNYTNALPWRFVRVRLACAWPVLIGIQTIRKLRQGNVLDPGQRIKISRKEVQAVILQTIWRYPRPEVWRQIYVPTGDNIRKTS
jgi:farnesyl-diphosphate farnesyltransferase